MIVSDAGPIIVFVRIRRLLLLRDVVGSLLIPDAVYDEIVVNKEGMPGACEVADAPWIQSTSVIDRSFAGNLPQALHAGEREAIALAKERGAQLLIDEFRGRRVATGLGIDVIGTLRILAEGKRRGHVPLVRPIVAEMQSSGYRFEHNLIRDFLERVNEA